MKNISASHLFSKYQEVAESEISFAKLRRRSVTAWDHIFSDHIFSDNIFSNYDFQDVRRLLGRLPGSLLCDCLTPDEYEDLKASKLGVFIKFKELDFGWTSRLVHFLLCFQLDIKKKFELWSLVVSQPVRFSLIEFEHLTGLNCDYIKDLENPRCEVTTEMAAFWEKMRVDIDTGPSIEQITEAFYNCDEWSRDDRMRLGYLAIYAGYIEGKKFSSATLASLARLAKDLTQTGYTVDGFIQVLQVWAYYAMPELGANYGSPIPNRPSPLLLAYKGGKRQRKCFKAAIHKQTIVKNFVQKDFDEMFPKWDGDVDDPAADNIIKVMFNDPGWEWTMECWPVTGTRKVVKMEVIPVKNEVSPVKSESVVKEESSRPRKKARKGSSVSAETPAAGSEGMTHQQIEKSLKDISDAINLGFGTCLKELKLLADRMEAVEKKVGITNRGGSSDDRQLTTTSNPPKPVDEPGSESVNGAKAGQKEAKEPSLTTEPSSSRELCLVSPADDLPSDDPSLLILDKQVSTASDLLVEEARRQTKKETALVGGGYDPFAPIDKMKSKELTAWVQKDPSYKLPLKKNHVDVEVDSIRRFGGVDVDDIYAPVNFKNQHWIAIWISIPKRHIVVWDSIVSHISPEELDEVMEPFVTMVPYLLVECALSDEQKVQYTLEPYTYARQTVGVPQCRAGDCGPFTLKYIECYALGIEFPTAFDKKHGKTIREKMALDIFRELPKCHEWENQDNDENLATYD
ncbi:hypothetical protein IGI04_006721 [Brassica rapa subsp. trilocularis]|uniref:Ubiquitin-like protease family profile domain-containing protein n=1 Tax=Brassica rapa subsp. trilocularis TaxID=1813537 RepID=A0ABQ7NHN6_BRACM|nr:hypothetical protein IGI04_006721 [Brassica rapa subsp. trilocularis]